MIFLICLVAWLLIGALTYVIDFYRARHMFYFWETEIKFVPLLVAAIFGILTLVLLFYIKRKTTHWTFDCETSGLHR